MWKLLILHFLVVWITIGIQGEENATYDVYSTTASTEARSTTTATSQEEDTPDKASTPQRKHVCSFPDQLRGEWRSTLWGNINVTESEIFFSSEVTKGGIKQLECYINSSESEHQYILKSPVPFTQFKTKFYWYSCLQFEPRNNDHFHVVVKTGRSADAKNYPLAGRPASEDIANPFDEFCQQSASERIEGDLLRQGRKEEGSQACPEIIKGVFDASYTDVHTQSRCEEGAKMVSCEPSNTVVFNYSSCHDNATQEFASLDVYYCIEGQEHLLLYRESDEKNDFTPFSCLTLSESNTKNTTIVTAVISPRGCGDSWKPEQNQHSTNETIVLTKAEECELKVTPTTSTTGAVTRGSFTTQPNTTDTVDNSTTNPSTTQTTTQGNAASLISSGFLIALTAAVATTVVSDFIGGRQ